MELRVGNRQIREGHSRACALTPAVVGSGGSPVSHLRPMCLFSQPAEDDTEIATATRRKKDNELCDRGERNEDDKDVIRAPSRQSATVARDCGSGRGRHVTGANLAVNSKRS